MSTHHGQYQPQNPGQLPPQDHGQSQPPHPVGGQAPGGRRFGAGALVVAAIIALVVGVGAGLAIGGPLLGGGSDEASAEGDLRTACRYAEELESKSPDEFALDDPVIWQVTAAGSLAVSAGYGGAGDEGLLTAGRELVAASQRLDGELFHEALDALQDYCG